MYMYDNEGISEFENLVAEFVAYKKNKSITSLSDCNDDEYGFDPYVSSFAATMPNMGIAHMNLSSDSECKGKQERTNADQYKLKMPTMPTRPKLDKAEPMTNKPNMPNYKPMDEMVYLDADMEHMKNHMCEINICIYPFVVEVLNEYEYEGSPVFEEKMNKELVTQLVDKVMDMAVASIKEAEEIHCEMSRGFWDRRRLLRSVVEHSILNELFGYRRPRYRKVCGHGHYYY